MSKSFLLRLISISKCADSLSPHTHTMRLAVADEDGVVLIHEDTMGPGNLAVHRVVAIGAVAFLDIADEDFEGAHYHIEVTDGMRLGVGEIDIAHASRPTAFAPESVAEVDGVH